MSLLLVSFIAGVLTVGAPCILPLLPVILGSASISGRQTKSWLRPLVITASLVVSVVVFTILLKLSTSLIRVPQEFWQFISGSIVLLLGLSLLWPILWERIPLINRLNLVSNKTMSAGYKKNNYKGDVLIGAALGPIFNSCSPTYLFIVAAILPVTFLTGLMYLTAYALGLGFSLLILAYGGQRIANKYGWLTMPKSIFKRAIGIIFIIVGIGILLGLDKDIQTFVLNQGWYNPLSNFEESIR